MNMEGRSRARRSLRRQKISSVADAYDAMSSSRSYRSALSEEQTVAEFWKNVGTQFDPDVTEALFEILRTRSAATV